MKKLSIIALLIAAFAALSLGGARAATAPSSRRSRN